MKVSLNTNIASIGAQRQLGRIQTEMSRVFERLSTGLRIAQVGDDPAGLSVAEQLKVNAKIYNQGIRNLNDGISLLNVADSAAGQLTEIVTRIMELAEQAGNGGLGSDQRIALDREAQELSKEFTRIVQTTEYNDLKLFDGTLEDGIRLQAGFGSEGMIAGSIGGDTGDGTFGATQEFGNGTSFRYDLQTGDLNGDGILDIVTADYAGDGINVLLGDGNGGFASETSFDAGGSAYQLSLGDLNGDGVLDIVTANLDDDTVSVMLGDGTGGFGTADVLDVGYLLYEVEMGDLNGDGILDLVTSGSTDSEFVILLGKGDGTFETSQSEFAGQPPTNFELGDLNGDGILDIVSGEVSGSLMVLLGNGDGSFGTTSFTAVGSWTYDVALADLNSDGNLDVVVTDHSGNEVHSLLGNGDGTFSSKTSVAVGTTPLSLDIGDINGDGLLDIVTANSASNDLSVLLGDGTGQFTLSETLASNSPTTVKLDDVNDDGVLDLLSAVQGNGKVGVSFGNTRDGVAVLVEFSLLTQADALQALAPLRNKLNLLSQQRGEIGAFQSRLDSATSVLNALSTESTAAESRIRDADIATETANLVKLQIQQQAAAAVLGQANNISSVALQLLS